jgi:succinate dehydrogenase / fumarate reductase membrane anchor subunit
MSGGSSNYRTPLSRARGLGSAKHGVSHFVSERIASIVLSLLTPWAIWSGIILARTDYSGAVMWLGSPVNAVLTLMLLIVGFWYMISSLRVVVEDYIQGAVPKSVILLLNLFVGVLGGALSAFCVLKVALSSGAF